LRDRPWRPTAPAHWLSGCAHPRQRGLLVQPCLWRVRQHIHSASGFPLLLTQPLLARCRVRASCGRVLWLFRTGSLGIWGCQYFLSGTVWSPPDPGLFNPLMIFNSNPTTASDPIQMGKYRIAACARELEDGAFASQVSIASGRGSASTDRVMRFTPQFSTRAAASGYAIEQGIQWVRDLARPQLLTP